MLRAVLWVGVLVSAGCTRNPYVIGEHVPDECQSELSGALACSGFEAEDVASGWTEINLEGTGEVEPSSERAHTGRGALRATSSGAESVAVVSREFEPVDSGTLYLRAHVFLAEEVPTETLNLFFIGDAPAPDPFVGIDINVHQGALQIFSPQIDPARQTGALQIPRDRWFCLRAELQVDEMDGAIELFVDDESALKVEAIDTLPGEGVRLLRAGIDWSSEQTEPLEVFMDDVALDTAPIACRD